MSKLRDKRVRAGRRGVVASAVALTACLALSSTATAGPDELRSGSVVIHLQGSRGLKLSPTSLSLPITGGQVDPVDGSGTVDVSGAFRAKRGKAKTRVKITGLTFAANGGHGSIAAKIGKTKVRRFATLAGGTVARDGWGAKLDGITAKLSSKGARALNVALTGGRATGHASTAGGGIKAGLPLGTVSADTIPKTVEVIPGSGTMVLATDSGLVTKLLAHCIDALPTASPPGVAPIAPATEDLTGGFTFPVTGGSVAPDFSDGRLITGGGQRITKNNDPLVLIQYPACSSQAPPVGTTVTQTELETQFSLNALAANSTLPTGPLGLAGLGTIDFSTGSRSIDPATRKLTVDNATVKFDSLTAYVLNQVFPNVSGNPSNDFSANDLLGTLSMTATLR